MKIVQKPEFLTGLVVGLIAAAVLGGLLFFLIFPLALKHRTSFPLEDAIGTNRVLAAVPAEYKRMANPLTVDAKTVAEGRTVYFGNCAVCHGPNGTGDSPIGKNLYPPAADLASARVIDMKDGEIAWIVKFGLSFVGMPAFKTLLSDQEVWQLVVFIRSLHPGAPAGGAVGGGQAAAGGTEATSGGQQAAAGGQAQGTSVPAAELARGKQLFAEKGCASCHGDNAGGGLGPPLSGTPRSLSAVLSRVRNGGGAMPAFDAASVSDTELKTIYQWLESRP
jgi:mono/diheme cytochrome c family protein